MMIDKMSERLVELVHELEKENEEPRFFHEVPWLYV
jgi:hypothetical protein